MGVEIIISTFPRLLPESCPARGMGVEILQKYLIFTFGMSCPARGMGVEMYLCIFPDSSASVMPREGHGSRNADWKKKAEDAEKVMPREGHGSRNVPINRLGLQTVKSHAPRGAWE